MQCPTLHSTVFGMFLIGIDELPIRQHRAGVVAVELAGAHMASNRLARLPRLDVKNGDTRPNPVRVFATGIRYHLKRASEHKHGVEPRTTARMIPNTTLRGIFNHECSYGPPLWPHIQRELHRKMMPDRVFEYHQPVGNNGATIG